MPDMPQREYFRILFVFGALGLPILLAKIYFLLALVFHWKKAKISRIVLFPLLILFAAMGFIYGREMTNYFEFGVIHHGRGDIFLIGLASVVIQIMILLAAFLPYKKSISLAEQRGLAPFALISLLSFIVYSASAYTNLNAIAPLLYYILLFPPLIFVMIFFSKTNSAQDPGETSLEVMAAHFSLTSREKEIVHFVLKGYSNRQIEKELFISQKTVKNHLTRIFRKAGVKSRSKLISLLLHAFPPK
jgi:DNA-binding CsgD family transcriptional regulator